MEKLLLYLSIDDHVGYKNKMRNSKQSENDRDEYMTPNKNSGFESLRTNKHFILPVGA